MHRWPSPDPFKKMTEANFPVSGLPLSVVSLVNRASGPLASCDLRHMLREQIHAAERRGEAAHGFFVRESDSLTGSDADIFFEIRDEGDESDAIQRGDFTEKTGLLVGLLQGRLAEFAAERGETTQHEGEGLFAIKHGVDGRRLRAW